MKSSFLHLNFLNHHSKFRYCEPRLKSHLLQETFSDSSPSFFQQLKTGHSLLASWLYLLHTSTTEMRTLQVLLIHFPYYSCKNSSRGGTVSVSPSPNTVQRTQKHQNSMCKASAWDGIYLK